MKYWLVKSEPSVYSWDEFEKDKKTVWDGVRNYAARLNLRGMKKGDLVLFYHSNEGKDIVGIAVVFREFFPDPTAEDGDWSAVELKPIKKLQKSVPLEKIKTEKKLKNMNLLKIGRLSVSSVTKIEFDTILSMADSK